VTQRSCSALPVPAHAALEGQQSQLHSCNLRLSACISPTIVLYSAESLKLQHMAPPFVHAEQHQKALTVTFQCSRLLRICKTAHRHVPALPHQKQGSCSSAPCIPAARSACKCRCSCHERGYVRFFRQCFKGGRCCVQEAGFAALDRGRLTVQQVAPFSILNS
jgi:hypothetical protein